jgi:hypothetical protein
VNLRVFSILFSPYRFWLDPDHWFLLTQLVQACMVALAA